MLTPEITYPEIPSLVSQIAEKLLQQQQSVAVAESCTGGWVAKVFTDLAGSSAWFDRGFVTYSNAAKQDMLGVSATTLETQGAVSEQTVIEMAEGVLQKSNAGYSLAISGIAGPGGGTTEKPVGLVWFAWAHRLADGRLKHSSQHQHFNGDRDSVRQQAVVFALSELLQLLPE